MYESKWFALSKTIVGILVSLLTVLLPEVGVEFGSEEGALITQGWDAIIVALSSAFAMYGRFAATTTLTVTPGGDDA